MSHQDFEKLWAKFEEKMEDLLYKSHNTIAQNSSNTGSQINQIKDTLNNFSKDIALIKQSIENIEKENIERNSKFSKALESWEIRFEPLERSKGLITGGLIILSSLLVPAMGWLFWQVIELIKITSLK